MSTSVSNEAEVLEPELSEGEKFIEEYFIAEDIEYRVQEKIPRLRGDNASYRVADFYLPKYKIYVEFLGNWNTSKDHKAAYQQKKKVYLMNGIPCIYIYPENLGIIEHVFHYRMKTELHKHGMHKELRKYLNKDFHSQNFSVYGYFIVSTILLGAAIGFQDDYITFLGRAWIFTNVVLGGFYLNELWKFRKTRKYERYPR